MTIFSHYTTTCPGRLERYPTEVSAYLKDAGICEFCTITSAKRGKKPCDYIVLGHQSKKPVNLWEGQGPSIQTHSNLINLYEKRTPTAKYEIVEPLDVIRDWLYLTKWKDKQQQILGLNPKVSILVAHELYTICNRIPEKITFQGRDLRVGVLKACNRIWKGSVVIETDSEILATPEYQKIFEWTRREIEKQPGLWSILNRTIPNAYIKYPEAKLYGLHEVAITLYKMGKDFYIKLGHLGETLYDKVTSHLGRHRGKHLSVIHLPLVPCLLPERYDYSTGKIGNRREISYFVHNPQGRLTINDSLQTVQEKVRQSCHSARRHWLDIIKELRERTGESLPPTSNSMEANPLGELLFDVVLAPIQTEVIK